MIMKQKTPSAVLAALWISAAAVLGLSACATQPTQESDITLYVFHCGNIESRDVSLFSPGVNQGQIKQLTNNQRSNDAMTNNRTTNRTTYGHPWTIQMLK